MKKILALFLVLLLSLSLVGCGKKEAEVEDTTPDDQVEDVYSSDTDDTEPTDEDASEYDYNSESNDEEETPEYDYNSESEVSAPLE